MPDISDAMKAARSQWAEAGLDHVRELVREKISGGPLHRKSGKLSAGVEESAKVIESQDGFQIGAGTFYGRIWERTGHAAFRIKVKKRRKLKRYAIRFTAGGGVVFARSAQIPAAAPRPFLKPSFEQSEPALQELAEELTGGAIRVSQPDRVITIEG